MNDSEAVAARETEKDIESWVRRSFNFYPADNGKAQELFEQGVKSLKNVHLELKKKKNSENSECKGTFPNMKKSIY